MTKVKVTKIPEGGLEHLEKMYSNAEIYDGLSKAEDRGNAVPKAVENMVDVSNKVVLDLGAGSGKLSIPLARKAQKVYALDKSKPLLKILRRRIRENGIRNIKVIDSEYRRIPLPKESVDLAVSLWSFPMHSDNWERDLKEVRRVLKNDGMMIFIDSHHTGEYRRIKKKTDDSEIYPKFVKSNKDMHRWFSAKGFSRKGLTILVDFRTKKNVEKYCAPFFCQPFALYLLARDKVSFKFNLSIFSRKK